MAAMTALENCPYCGSDLTPDDEICRNCWRELSTALAPVLRSRPAAAPGGATPARATEDQQESSTAAAQRCATEGCTRSVPPGQRYCVVCDLATAPTGLTYVLHSTWGEIALPPGAVVVVGRSPHEAPETAGFLSNADRVSRVHARLENRLGALHLVDLGSSNGTTVNGRRLRPDDDRTLLVDDVVVFGTQVRFQVLGTG